MRLAIPGEPASVTAQVEVIELTGPEKLVTAKVADARFTARIDPHSRIATGETRQFVFDAQAIRLFDRASGVAL